MDTYEVVLRLEYYTGYGWSDLTLTKEVAADSPEVAVARMVVDVVSKIDLEKLSVTGAEATYKSY